MRFWGTLCVVIAVVLGALAVPVRVARAAESCPDVLVLGSRGSGESAIDNNGVGPAVDAFYTGFQPMVTAAGKTIELWANGKADTPEEIAAQYPAVPVSGGWDWLVNGLGAGLAIGKGVFGGYQRSVAKGEANLRAKIKSVTDNCADTQLVLSGYSQGAQVTGNVYRSLPADQRDRVLGVALFGDPLLNGKARTSLGNLERNRNGLLTN